MRKYLVVSFILFISSITITSAHTFHGVSMAPNTLKGWVSGDTGLVYCTQNCGINWIDQSFATTRWLSDIFFINEQKGWVAGNCAGYIYYTENGGTTWLLQIQGLACFIRRFFFIDDSCGWAGCYGAIIGRTTSGGQNYSWEQIWLPCPPFNLDTADVCGISFVDRQRGWICTGCYLRDIEPYDTLWGGQGYIAKSNDGGLNWQLLRRDTIYDFFDIKFLDSLNGFVVGGNDRTMLAVIMKTQNGGVNWQNVTIPSQAKYLRSLKFQGNQAWAVGHRGTILHSDNGGNTWTLQISPVDTTLYDIDFSDSIHGLIAGDGCVLYTHNGGVTWNIANLGIEEEIASLPLAMTSVVELYPNPAKSYFIIRLPLTADRQKVSIFDVSGKLVKEIRDCFASARNDNIVKISLGGIQSGVYFVSLESESKRIIERLVIIK